MKFMSRMSPPLFQASMSAAAAGARSRCGALPDLVQLGAGNRYGTELAAGLQSRTQPHEADADTRSPISTASRLPLCGGDEEVDKGLAVEEAFPE